jgi:hypothetical protein
MPENTAELQTAIRAVHGCESEYLTRVRVYETFEGQPAREGIVQVFRLL